jgi:hypothetical protein
VQNGAAHSCSVLPGVLGDAAHAKHCLKNSYFQPEKTGSKKSLEFFFPATCILFSPGLSFHVLRTNHCDSSAPRFFSEKGSY